MLPEVAGLRINERGHVEEQSKRSINQFGIRNNFEIRSNADWCLWRDEQDLSHLEGVWVENIVRSNQRFQRDPKAFSDRG